MMKLISKLKRSLLIGLAVVMVNIPGAAVFADDPAPCVPPTSNQPGVHQPTGSAAPSYTYQCTGQYAGEWTSQYYVFNPADNSVTPLYDLDYTYDCAAGTWSMIDWVYSPAKGAYYQTTVQTPAPAGQATNCPVVNPPASTDPTTGGTGSTTNSINPNAAALPPTPTSGGSSTSINGNNNVGVTNTTTATMNNGIVSFAVSGDATVTGNTNAGSATSGTAQSIANVINMLQSSSNVLNDPNMVTFTANINGDVNGDLMLDPSQLGTIQPANSSTTLDNNVTVNNSTDAAINNNIDLTANSGDANVDGNTSGGNATSGGANAVANIVNIINSAVTAGQSFIGVININGNLNGDILLPPDFANTLLANNVPHYTVNTADLTSNVDVNNTNNDAINNNVNAVSKSGSATVAGNTSGGNATSGLASTNLTVFNLTGSSVVATNDLLVFVNVLGTWYGMIMNAPAGSTAAELGGGVSSNTTVDNNATLNNTNNQTINNNVNVKANSGNADVSNNTSGGNATSGDATSSVNLLNMINDKLSLNGWFGLLFINVYGTWNGSFGVNTAAGDPTTTNTSSGSSDTGSGPMFQFSAVVPGASNKDYSVGANNSSAPVGNTIGGSVLAAKTVKTSTKSPSVDAVTPSEKTVNHLLLPILGASFAFLILFAGERRNRFVHRG